MQCAIFLLLFIYLFHFYSADSYLAKNSIQKENQALYAGKTRKRKKKKKLVDITVSSDNEIGKKGEIKRVKLSHAFNYIIPQKLGYRTPIDELAEKEKKENIVKYIEEIETKFIHDYKKKLHNLIIPFSFKKTENFVVTEEDIINYLLIKGFIREYDDVYKKIKNKQMKFSKFGKYPVKYTFVDNISIGMDIHIMEKIEK